MRFDGEWLQCDDGIIRPVIRAEIAVGDGSWRALELLVDTGADRTVISADVLESLRAEESTAKGQIGGIGGLVDTVTVRTQIRMSLDDGGKVVLRGDYAACTTQEDLDMSVLGRDILEMFAVIVDRPANVLAFLRGRHSYSIASGPL